MKNFREKQIERYLVDEVRRLDGQCWKLEGTIGIPDRMVLLPGGRVVFVEVKAAKGRLSKWQIRRHEQMRRLGTHPVVVWSHEDVDALLAQYAE